ncbi:hypothetical protein VTN77DRAFT_2056 [Rasamsonia byssochlamydoides]|uniref:uncharacterized protein n=1 Tax=Rasamsonia byssochlamydoides TaxID=89139 RepID=UPI003742C187
MRAVFSASVAALGLSALAAASPVPRSSSPFPLKNGFPNPNQTELHQIELQAFGTLSNGPPPANISREGILNLQVIALNELFEVAFFDSLIHNITTNVSGFKIENIEARELLLKALVAAKAQEELHALNANNALEKFTGQPIQPCQYTFPSTDLESAIALAGTFTSVVLGTLQDVILVFAQNGDVGLTSAVASVVGQEGEQEGYFRLLQGKVPNELPFLTTSTRDFALNALNQTFFVPGSCPNLNIITGLNVFEPLTLLSTPKAVTEPIQFRFENTAGLNTAGLKVVYINQQNLPIVEDFTVVKTEGATVTIEANFPYEENELNGLTIAALAETSASGNFTNAQAVADATKFGPALIIVN